MHGLQSTINGHLLFPRSSLFRKKLKLNITHYYIITIVWQISKGTLRLCWCSPTLPLESRTTWFSDPPLGWVPTYADIYIYIYIFILGPGGQRTPSEFQHIYIYIHRVTYIRWIILKQWATIIKAVMLVDWVMTSINLFLNRITAECCVHLGVDRRPWMYD